MLILRPEPPELVHAQSPGGGLGSVRVPVERQLRIDRSADGAGAA